MIKKQDAQAGGIKTLDGSKVLAHHKNEKLEALKKLAPHLINSDGQLDANALNDFINISQTTSNNRGYELTFAGKGIARAKADTETLFELKTEKAQSKNFDTTENMLIRGDNLEVLKILKQNYFEKIKMIYIDPPYNTKSENFVYKDNFKQDEAELIANFGLEERTTDFLQNVYGTRSHSGWLSFMYPRLKLARDLLKDDGVIFISIDDNEQANLKILCDEIFGEENFVSVFLWKKNKSGNQNANYVSVQHDYILAIVKNKDREKWRLPYSSDDLKDYKQKDEKGVFYWKPVKHSTRGRDTEILFQGKLYIIEKSVYSQKTLLEMLNSDEAKFRTNSKGAKQLYKKQRLSKGVLPYSFLESGKFPMTEDGEEEVSSLFNFSVFDNPKPIQLIKHFIGIGSNKNDLILDFFAGSGTTGDAVMQLNAEDGGNRKFILVQWDEAIKEKTEAYKFCTEHHFKPVISSITIERLNRAGDKIKNQFSDDKKLDIGYKVFSLTPKPTLAENQDGLFALEHHRATTADKLYNMLSASGKPLHTSIKELKKDVLYLVDFEQEKALYLLGNIEDLQGYEDAQIFIDGWADINLEQWLNLFGMNEKEADKERVVVVY